MKIQTRMTLLAALTSAIALVPTCVAQAANGKFRAVVAIATKYTNQLTPEPGLAGAVPNLDRALRSYARRLGYSESANQIDIKFLLDVDNVKASHLLSTADEIRASVYNAAYESSKGDTLIFYFSGHGASEGASTVLFASGADGRRPIAKVYLEREILTSVWKQSEATIKIIAIDACQTPVAGGLEGASAPLAIGALGLLSQSERSANLGDQGTAIFFAADEGGVAWVDPLFGYGFFTHRFLEAIEDSRLTTAEKLGAELRTSVNADVQTRFPGSNRSQRPVWQHLASPGGDYQLNSIQTEAIDRSTIEVKNPPSPTPLVAQRELEGQQEGPRITSRVETIADACAPRVHNLKKEILENQRLEIDIQKSFGISTSCKLNNVDILSENDGTQRTIGNTFAYEPASPGRKVINLKLTTTNDKRVSSEAVEIEIVVASLPRAKITSIK